jgi:uncharacterized membrane protein HdeD (DUF308 family)
VALNAVGRVEVTMKRVSRIALSAAFIILGLVAMARPFLAGLAAARLVGWLLVAGGLVRGIGALVGEYAGVGRTVWAVFLGALYVAAGLFFIMRPLLGLGSLTLLLSMVFIAEAILTIAVYGGRPRATRSPLLIVQAVVTLLVGLMIWMGWPSTAVWAIGTLVGINLMMTGIAILMQRAGSGAASPGVPA